MSRITQRKVFRALTASVVEKRFIAADEATPDGWHDDQSAALAAYPKSAHEVQAEEAPKAAEEVTAQGIPHGIPQEGGVPTKPRRGRPRKAA